MTGQEQKTVQINLQPPALIKPGVMIRVTDDFFCCREDVATIENYDYETYAGGSVSDSSVIRHSGVIVVLKNGRKSHLKGWRAPEIYEKIFGKDAVVT